MGTLSACAPVSTTGDSGKQGTTVPRGGRGEKRLQVVLNGVLGEEHLLGDAASVGAGNEVPQQFGLSRAEAEGTGKDVRPLCIRTVVSLNLGLGLLLALTGRGAR